LYGMGNNSLSEKLRISFEDAVKVSEQFHQLIPGVIQFQQKFFEETRNLKFVRTLLGRVRYFPGLIFI